LICLGRAPFRGRKPSQEGLEKLGFPWILSSELSLFKGLHGNFSGIIFGGVSPRNGGLVADGREIAGHAVDLVDEPLTLLRPIRMFRHNVLCPVL
jgi:hypothetical protein